MKKIFGFASVGCGVAVPCMVRPIHTVEVGAKEETQKYPDKQFGYDMYNKNIKKYSVSEQRKVKQVFKSRADHIRELKDPKNQYDVLIIGGGCNGAGTIFDAETRGLKCALIDSGDFASGTSSRSTKLIHGGIRYLEEAFKLEKGFVEKFALVVEGLDERNFMLNSAAYLNKKLEMVVPCGNVFKLVYFYAGVCLYHFLSFAKWCFSDYTYRLPRPSIMTKDEMKSNFPALKGSNYGVRFCEGQMNDARLCMQTLLTSAQDDYVPNMKGATLGNYVEFLDFVKDSKGKIVGAKCRDKLDNSEFTIKAKAIVNCAGAFSDQIRLKDNPKVTPRIVGSRGVHIIIPTKYTNKGLGILIPKTVDGRVMFVLPYQGLTIAGTTDHKCDIVSAPVAPPEDIKEIANQLSYYFDGDLEKECTAAWCGIRPLVAAKPKAPSKFSQSWSAFKNRVFRFIGKEQKNLSTKSLTRSHEIEVSDSGLVSLLGGKWTAYRRMGQDAVDAVLKEHPEIVPVHKGSISRNIRLIGAYTSKTLDKSEKNIDDFINHYKRFLHEEYGLEWDTCTHLVEHYGTNAIQVVELGVQTGTNQKLHKDSPVIKAQVLFAVRKELAQNTRDVIFRRLGIGFVNQKTAVEVVPAVAELMAKEMNWDDKRKATEIENAKKTVLALA